MKIIPTHMVNLLTISKWMAIIKSIRCIFWIMSYLSNRRYFIKSLPFIGHKTNLNLFVNWLLKCHKNEFSWPHYDAPNFRHTATRVGFKCKHVPSWHLPQCLWSRRSMEERCPIFGWSVCHDLLSSKQTFHTKCVPGGCLGAPVSKDVICSLNDWNVCNSYTQHF